MSHRALAIRDERLGKEIRIFAETMSDNEYRQRLHYDICFMSQNEGDTVQNVA